jgi:DNA-binding transcriptional LysR family regulator
VSLDLRLTDDHENLIEAGIDVAIRMGSLPDSGLTRRRLCGLQRIVVAAPDLLARQGTPQSHRDLAGMDCLAWDGSRDHLNRWPFVEAGAPAHFRAESRFRSNQGMSLYHMCLAGVGVMRMAEHLARPAIAEGRLVQLLADQTPADASAIHAVYPPDRQVVPRLRSFLDFLVAAFRAPGWEAGARPSEGG